MKRIAFLLTIISVPILVLIVKNMNEPGFLVNSPVNTRFIESENTLLQTEDNNKIQINLNDEEVNQNSIPSRHALNNTYHIFQSFNNCGPASLSMALSYFNIRVSQEELGRKLRPYQNPKGDNDDKSVTLEELAKEAENYGLVAYHRPNGNLDLLTKFISNDIPVITRTWLKVNDDIGHYRVIKGYDKETKQILQDDSLQGKNIWYSYEEFEQMWNKFNNEYLVIAPKENNELIIYILGENYDENTAWQNAANFLKEKTDTNPADAGPRLNYSVALFHIGDYTTSVREFEKIENNLAPRALWYQIEPILSYYKVGNYEKVFSLSDKILENGNRAYSELYLIRMEVYLKQGKEQEAAAELERALRYNRYIDPKKYSNL